MAEIEGEYIVILGYDGGEHEVYGCKDMTDVYLLLTDRIHDELLTLTSDDPEFTLWPHSAEIKDFADNILNSKIIPDSSVLIDCYDTFFADCWWFKVIDIYGSVVFEYIP